MPRQQLGVSVLQPCSGRATIVQRKIVDLEKERSADAMEENPSEFINHREPLFQVGNT